MKYITVKLTEKQALYLVHSLWMDIDREHDASKPVNAFVIRIANKITKALGKAKLS